MFSSAEMLNKNETGKKKKEKEHFLNPFISFIGYVVSLCELLHGIWLI